MTQQQFDEFINAQGLIWEYSGKKVIDGQGWFGPGWYNLTAQLITDLIVLGWDKSLAQVKEKFGGGRFYIGAGSIAIWDRILDWERETFKTCEQCGTQENVLTHGPAWTKTLCSSCRTYTQEQVYEILRQVMFTGTPKLYDQGGMHKSIKPTNTLQRAKDAFKKYYLKR